MKTGRRTVVLGISVLMINAMCAKDKAVRSADSFDTVLARAPYSVVLFYDNSRENRRDPAMRGEIKGLETMFRELSRDPSYKEAELQFVRVDVARHGLAEVAQRYQLRTFPAAMLFLGGKATGAQLMGKIYRDELSTLIDRTFKSQMESVLKEKEQQRRRELERARIRAYNAAYWGPYWGWGYGYPYGGWRYGGYWGRPGFYIGF